MGAVRRLAAAVIGTAIIGAGLFAGAARGATVEVGPGKAHGRIEEALRAATAGDTILVHPLEGGKPYARSALLVRTPRLAFKAARAEGGPLVKIDGSGFEYSGAGSVPRAIFQFDPGAGGCTVDGFDLSGARNDSSNGAGIRINAANDIAVRDCEIHGCDMGVMSNGDARKGEARNQRIERCRVHGNGSDRHAGFNHNFYLGGTSVLLLGCEVFASTTGHNVKSRAHLTWVEACRIHESANRELDLVDAEGNTDIPESHAVLIGNVIFKAKEMAGNRTVIHFGQDGGKDHKGTIYLVHNTIITPYIGPVVELSAPGTSARLVGNLVWDAGAGQRNQVAAAARNGARIEAVTGEGNWIAAEFALPAGMSRDRNVVAKPEEEPPFRDAKAGDYRVRQGSKSGAIDPPIQIDGLGLPSMPQKGARGQE
jgi:hypothetical protein